MYDKHASLESRKLAEKNGVEDDREQRRANRQQHAMPGRDSISGIVQSDHSLHCQSSTVASTDKRSLPAQNLGADQSSSFQLCNRLLTLSQPVMYDRNCWYSLGANSETLQSKCRSQYRDIDILLGCNSRSRTSDTVRRWVYLSQLIVYTKSLVATYAVGAMLAISAIESVAKIEPTMTMT